VQAPLPSSEDGAALDAPAGDAAGESPPLARQPDVWEYDAHGNSSDEDIDESVAEFGFRAHALQAGAVDLEGIAARMRDVWKHPFEAEAVALLTSGCDMQLRELVQDAREA